MNVLIVDDQTFIREIIKREFCQVAPDTEFHFQEADCGNTAIKILSEAPLNVSYQFDLVIADLKMENGDGLAIINHMATTRSREIPLVIVSSSDKRTLELIGNITNSFSLNLVGVFQKPLDIPEIYASVAAKKKRTHCSPNKHIEVPLCNSGNITSLLNEDNLFLCYQPKIEIATGKLIGFEVLSRLCIQGDGFIYPDKFIPLVEDAGLNCQLTKLVLSQALSQWHLFESLKDYRLSINISASDLLSDEFINYVIDKHLANADIKLMLELTESQQTINEDRSLQAIAKFIINDIPISLDDFGKSYSTLDRLDSIPFDEIKIDKDFVSDLDKNHQHQAIVESIIALAQKLNVKVVAEGVETLSIQNHLLKMGCHSAQGYFISPPIEGRYLMSWINSYNHKREQKYANG
ncbi:EAL domain-containing response regulator [Shewanella schlegeliana]|uniref:EAL domain-containing response regulator n=1 Tax=Shewanella schlegeliana TaxID=190308 RepID=A0ABS1SU44_9GAMM|nr:EAL domain-containing response regulator [Shewanella schlegeliana]MBL4912061.1 EAL domain-containing response regulator [Shewanella schlegeliana]MCL1111342.1 EAL domain-containing response regulator [Shewanella schlegeliana]GIU33087.1 transcriptional regulator [Shewanella schlegeliana]